MRSLRRLVVCGVVACVVVGCGGTGAARPPGATSPTVSIPTPPDPAISAVVARYQARIPELMAEQDVPGLSVAVVDGDHVLWAQGFGYVDRAHSAPVTLDTMFSAESMSKFFTATAVMKAVQAGLVGLDAPITTYLPDFTVHSAFEQHPERKITLRMLLSHTAGFTHEAPVGNNFELDPGTFEQHVKSISDTWLRFPVGTGFAYSNLGIDLAGYILEKVYAKPLAQVMNDTVLAPIGMDHSTFDRARIHATTDRAVGYTGLQIPVPTIDVAMTGAGGLFTSATDLARFLSFEIADGSINGHTVLDSSLIEEQRTIVAPNASPLSGAGLGVIRARWRNQDIFNHAGGGYGFLSDLWFVPSMKLGVALLTNTSENNLQVNLPLSILNDLVDAPGSAYAQRTDATPYQSNPPDTNVSFQAPQAEAALISVVAMPSSADQSTRWAGYVGGYQIASMGVINPMAPAYRFEVSDGVPYFWTSDNDNGPPVQQQLAEFQPGLFIADNGETLDFRNPAKPTWRNVDLLPATGGPAAWQWALLALAGAVAILWFVGGLWAAVRGWRQRRRTGGEATTGGGAGRRWRWSLWILGSLTSAFAIATIGTIAVLPGLVDSGFLGGVQALLPLRLIFHLPLALTLAGGCLIVLTAVGVARHRFAARAQLRVVALSVATALLVAQLVAWHLIGWGFS